MQDPNQKSIMEMFQRSFSAEDDMDEAILQELTNSWDPEHGSSQHLGMIGQKPGKQSITDFFSR